MKFTCSTKDIAAAVGAANKIVNGHTTVPILANVLVTADAHDGSVTVTATDLELTIKKAFPAEISEPGSLTVPSKLFSGYLGNLPAGLLELSGLETRTAVKADRSQYEFLGLPSDEYPPLPGAQKGASISINGATFREAVTATIFAASSEESRGAVLMATLIEIRGNAIVMAATDGYRLAKWTGTLDRGLPAKSTATYIVPSRALAEAARNLGGSDMIELCAMGPQSNQLALTAGATSIVVRLVDGQYPNYEAVVPQRFDRSITIENAALIGGLRRAEVMAGDKAALVKLAIADSAVSITATSDANGNAYEEFPVEQTGADLTVAFNAKYLLDILNHIDSTQIMIEFLGPLSPAAIRPVGNNERGEIFYVLMPLRQ